MSNYEQPAAINEEEAVFQNAFSPEEALSALITASQDELTALRQRGSHDTKDREAQLQHEVDSMLETMFENMSVNEQV